MDSGLQQLALCLFFILCRLFQATAEDDWKIATATLSRDRDGSSSVATGSLFSLSPLFFFLLSSGLTRLIGSDRRRLWVWRSEAEQLCRLQRRPEREAVQQGKQLRSLSRSAVREPHPLVSSRQPLRGGHRHRFLSSQFGTLLRLRRLVQLPKGTLGTISCRLHRDRRNQS